MSDMVLVPLSDTEELAWQERALCAQTDPEAFFPEKGGSTREAKKVCLSCDVRVECLEYALQSELNLSGCDQLHMLLQFYPGYRSHNDLRALW